MSPAGRPAGAGVASGRGGPSNGTGAVQGDADPRPWAGRPLGRVGSGQQVVEAQRQVGAHDRVGGVVGLVVHLAGQSLTGKADIGG